MPCDEYGNYLLPGAAPPPRHPDPAPDNWAPFRDRTEFETAEFIYCRTQMSGTNIDRLMDLWASTLLKHDDSPPFANHTDLYRTIDSIPLGDIPWESVSLKFNGTQPDGELPPWMEQEYQIWFRDPRAVIHQMLANPEYNNNVDYAPVQVFNKDGNREYKNLMSGDWAWKQAVSFFHQF